MAGIKYERVGRMKATPVPPDRPELLFKKRLQGFLRVHFFELSTRFSVDCLTYLKVLSARQI